MAKRLIDAPGIADKNNFRARESFDSALEGMLQFVAETTVDLGSIAAGAVGSFTVPIQGVRSDMGMTVQVGVGSTWNSGLIVSGFVSANDIVTVVVFNSTGSPIDPPSQLFGIRVMP